MDSPLTRYGRTLAQWQDTQFFYRVMDGWNDPLDIGKTWLERRCKCGKDWEFVQHVIEFDQIDIKDIEIKKAG